MNRISPKVIAPAVSGVVLTVLIAALGAVDINALDFIPEVWRPAVAAGVAAFIGALAGYLKEDPDRVTHQLDPDVVDDEFGPDHDDESNL